MADEKACHCPIKRNDLFDKEVRMLLYCCGDGGTPFSETVDALNDVLVEYITEMTTKLTTVSQNLKQQVQVEDLIFLVRNDPAKFSRIRELLSAGEELRKARKAFDEQKFAKT